MCNCLYIIIMLEELIADQYKSGLPGTKIAQNLNLKKDQVYRILKKLNITRSMSQAKRRYPLNEAYFENLDTGNHFYWLGFIIADGHNSEIQNSLTITLAEKDREILENLKRDIRSSAPIKILSPKNTTYKYVRLNLNSRRLSESLKKLGIEQKKTFNVRLNKLSIPKLYLPEFVRGYFDGDGSVSVAGFSLTGNQYVCLYILEILKRVTNSQATLRKFRNSFTFNIGGRLQLRKIYDYLYRDPTTYLIRKKLKFESSI
jgi:intein/homing endonuclease